MNNDWWIVLAILAAGPFAGWLADRLILRRLEHLAGRSIWKGDDILVAAVRGLPRLWCILLAVHLAQRWAPVDAYHHELIGRVVEVLFILSLTVAASRAAVGTFDLYAEQLSQTGRTSIFANLIRASVIIMGLLVVLQTEGINIAPVLTALGVGGLAVALALQDTLSNLFAGIHILMARQLRPGDFVRLENGNEGFVEDISWRTTSIRTLLHTQVVIPNAKLAGSILVNHSQPTLDMVLVVPFLVDYDADLERVERITREVAQVVISDNVNALPEPPPNVGFKAFGDSGIEGFCSLRVRSPDAQFPVRTAFIKALHARFAQEGLEMPYPTRTVRMIGPA